jgi:hypothetical protein
MKKKVVSNKFKTTREANIYPNTNELKEKFKNFHPIIKDHTIETKNGYWVFNFKNEENPK